MLKSPIDTFEALATLIEIVRKIPYYCGKPGCTHPSCLEIRAARDLILECYNDPTLGRRLRGETGSGAGAG